MDKYLDLARELKRLWNAKVTMIPIKVGGIGTIPKGLMKRLEKLEIRRKSETLEITVLLRSARIPGGIVETWGDLLSFSYLWKTTSTSWCENLARSTIIIIIIIIREKYQTKSLENKNGKKNNGTVTSSNKLKKSHVRWLGRGKEKGRDKERGGAKKEAGQRKGNIKGEIGSF